MTAKKAQKELRKHVKPGKAEGLKRFFKTGKGEYGEGDVFIGVMVPQTRSVARAFSQLPAKEIEKLLKSKVHEDRLLGLSILVEQSAGKETDALEKTFRTYIRNRKWVNNWDLVDCTAAPIVGRHLAKRDRSLLYDYARSSVMWERRIAIVATFHFIRNNDLDDTFKIAQMLLEDEHDLMHKATGWMLREAGKRDSKRLIAFLKKHYDRLPRTLLRYAIEKFPLATRKQYLKGKF